MADDSVFISLARTIAPKKNRHVKAAKLKKVNVMTESKVLKNK